MYVFALLLSVLMSLFDPTLCTDKPIHHDNVQLFAEMLKVVLHGKMSFFDTTPVGRLVNRFSGGKNRVVFGHLSS